MSWMDSWSRPSKSQATPAPYYLLPGGENTPYCHSCGRVISSRRTAGNSTATAAAAGRDQEVKYCSSRCRSHKPGKMDREIEGVFVSLLRGAVENARDGSVAAAATKTRPQKSKKPGGGKKTKGDARILVSCDEVERHFFPQEDAGSASGTEDGHTDGSSANPGEEEEEQEPQLAPQSQRQGTHPSDPFPASSGTLDDPTSDAPDVVDYDRLARLSIRSGTRIRPPQNVSEVNGSVGGEKGRAERLGETGEMLEKRREGMRKVRQREMVRCAARRGVVFGFEVGDEDGQEPGEMTTRRQCEAVMLGKVVEPSFAKGSWGVRWRE